MQEIRKVIDYRSSQVGGAGQVLALCLSSRCFGFHAACLSFLNYDFCTFGDCIRRNMCIHTDVMEDSDRDAVDSLCRLVKCLIHW